MIQPLENGRGVPIRDLLPRDVRNSLFRLRDELNADERAEVEERRAALEEVLYLLHLPDSERPLMRGSSLRIAGEKR